MGKILKIKPNFLFLLFLFCFVIKSFGQTVVSFSKLKERENKLYFGDQVFTGLVVKTFITNQPKSISEVKEGLINGKVIEFIEDISFTSRSYRDTFELNKLNLQFSNKKKELEIVVQDTTKTSKEEKDFINYEIGGFEKLEKLKEKDAEGKLNKNKKELFDKYQLLAQSKNQLIRKLIVIQSQINSINQQIQFENNKPTYISKKSIEYNLLDGLKEGKAIIYDSLGNKFGEGEFLNDKQNGLWTYYYPNGAKLAQGKFAIGDGGNKGKTGIPKNGREGNWELYHQNGFLESISEYNAGMLSGNSKFYFNNGQLEEESNYKDGMLNGSFKSYYENGKLEKEANYKDNKLNGSFKAYYDNGRLSEESIYVNNKSEGKARFYFESGKIEQESIYLNGEKTGLEIIYFENGTLKKELYLHNGKVNGKVRTFYESGKLESEFQMFNDKAHGDFIKYFENGKINIKAKIDSASLAKAKWVGDYIVYNEDGSLKEHLFMHKDGRTEVKQTNASGSKNENSNSQHECSWCGKSFKGLGWEIDHRWLYSTDPCSASQITLELVNYDLLKIDRYCSKKCAIEKCNAD